MTDSPDEKQQDPAPDPFQAMAYQLLDEGHLEPDDLFLQDDDPAEEGWLRSKLRRLRERWGPAR